MERRQRQGSGEKARVLQRQPGESFPVNRLGTDPEMGREEGKVSYGPFTGPATVAGDPLPQG